MDDDLIFHEARPPRADAVKNRELLLHTAAQLFAAQGLEAVTMSQVAEAAGVGKGTLYRHFASKMELCEALLDHEQRHLQEDLFARIRAHPDDARGTLRWFLTEVIAFNERNGNLMPAHEAPLLLRHPAHLWWRQTIRGLLARLRFSGDLDYVTDMLYVMLDVNIQRFQRETLGYSTERLTEALLAVVDQVLK